MMAEDPSLDRRGREAARRPARPPSAPCTRRSPRSATCSPAWAATWASAPPTSTTSSQRVIAHLLKLPAARRARTPGTRSCSSPATSRPPTPRMLDLDQVLGARHVRGRPDLAHRDPRPREVDRRGRRRSGRREPRRRRHGHRRRGRRPRHRRPHSRRRSPTRTARIAERAAPRGRARSRPARSPTARPVPLLANLGSADGAAEAVELGAEGVGPVPHRVPLPRRRTRRRACASSRSSTRGCSRRSRAGRSSCACSTPAPTSRSRSSTTRTRRTPRSGSAASAPCAHSEDILREQLTALAAADAATDGRALGHGADDRDRRGDPRTSSTLAKELGIRTAGVMVEVPSAALLADRILADADFASIGTNDLTQYTLAADRLLGIGRELPGPVASRRAPPRRARSAPPGAEHGKPVGICGEAAADPLLAVVLVGLGATSLSMSPIGTRRRPRLPRAVHPDDAKAHRRGRPGRRGSGRARSRRPRAAAHPSHAPRTRPSAP